MKEKKKSHGTRQPNLEFLKLFHITNFHASFRQSSQTVTWRIKTNLHAHKMQFNPQQIIKKKNIPMTFYFAVWRKNQRKIIYTTRFSPDKLHLMSKKVLSSHTTALRLFSPFFLSRFPARKSKTKKKKLPERKIAALNVIMNVRKK